MTRAEALLAAVLALALAVVGFSPARGDDAPSGTVNVTSVSSTILDPAATTATLTISGTFTNTSPIALGGLSAQVWHVGAPLTSFERISAELDAASQSPTAAQPATALLPDATLAPGATVPFSVTAPVGALGASDEELATIVGVRIQARADAGDAPAQPQLPTLDVSSQRLVLPHEGSTFTGGDVVVLSSESKPTPDSERVPTELATAIEGPLTEALARAERPGALAVIDPMVYDAAQRLATATREPSAIAQDFVERVDALHEKGALRRLAVGNPSLPRLPDDLRANLVAWSDELTPEPLAEAPLVAFAADAGQARALTARDSGFAGALVPVAASGGERWFVVDSGHEWDPVAGLPVSPARGQTPTTTPGARWSAVDRAFEVAEARTPLRAVLTTGGDDVATDLRPLRMAAYSADFPDEASALAYVRSSPALTFDAAGISFQASPAFVMGQRESNFPTTITNKTGVAVHVKVAFTSDNPLRMEVPDSDVVRVAPGESLTLQVSPHATANGVTVVHAHLEAVDGTRLSPDTPIEITATEFGRVGWIIIIVSGVVVLGGTVLRIRAVQRERGKEHSESGQ